MDLKMLSSKIKSEFPEYAIDLNECCDLLLDTLDNIKRAIKKKVNYAYDDNKYYSINKYVDLAENIDIIVNKLLEIKNDLEPDNENVDVKNEESRVIPNYEEYYVDPNIPHSLYENLSHKRPYAFEFNKQKYETKTWVEVLIKTCEVLYNIDDKIFRSFEHDRKMNGKKSKYFSRNSELLRKPVLLDKTDIYIETNMSANSIRNLIVKMLQKYDYKISDYILYFRADYSELHKD